MYTTDPRLVALRDSLTGRTLKGSGRAQYILRERIGEGGQGWVFTANWDEPGGFVVIVKVLRPDAVNADTLRRFQREADVLRMLSQQGTPNPYIVRFFDHATTTVDKYSLPFTVLEYVNGVTLEKVIDSQPGKGLTAERTRRILKQVSMALELVHGQKVIHRDLKPSNILLAIEAGTEVAKVTDFGLVKLIDVSLQRTTTLAGASLGYAPPEQYEQGNQRVSPKTDVFSLAGIAFEMLSGKMAFPYRAGENPLLIVTRILNGPRPSLLTEADALAPELRGRPDLVALLDTQLGKALAADPADRHTSVADFFGSIEPVLRAAAEARAASSPPLSRALPFSETIPATAEHMVASLRPSQVPVIVSSVPQQAFTGPMPSVNGTPMSAQQASVATVSAQAASDGPWAHAPQHRPQGDTSNPALWSWNVTTKPVKAEVVRGAAMLDATSCIAIGPAGLARWERGEWTGVSLPAGFDPSRARGVLRFANGDYFIFGEMGLGLRLAASGAHAVLTTADPDAVFHGAYLDADGTITLVGDRPSRSSVQATTFTDRVGVVVQYQNGRLSLMADAAPAGRLRGVTKLANGTLVCCGDRGSLVRVRSGAVEYVSSLCGGDLLAIASLPDGGCVTVGGGGHALSLTTSFEAKLEAVQTTRDLLCVAVSSEGTSWAGAQQARLVRRTGDSWVRMSGELGVSAPVVAVWCGHRQVRAVCTDGAVIEGNLP